MVSEKNLANVVGGKTARACDSCIRKRARWYCAADDAFLCQACDASVHSANPLARKHKRVRLKTASIKPFDDESLLENSLPSWDKGFKRKARTPRFSTRKAKGEEPNRNPIHLVPDIGGDENLNEENEEQLLYRVPIFDPFLAEICTSTNSNEVVETKDIVGSESKTMLYDCTHDVNSLHGFLPSEKELEEFAADVESLLGKGLDEESFDMEELGFLDCKEKVLLDGFLTSGGKVKVEENEQVEFSMANNQVDMEIDMTREPFEFNFDYGSPFTNEEDDKVEGAEIIVKEDEGCKVDEMKKKKKKISLRLDYEGVLATWADQRSPWTTGERPEYNPNDCWPACLGGCGTVHHPYGEVGIIMCGQSSAMVDGGREARVSRYREKRRTRLFSKKIRYEVRKLNAEKRPRMKGRFVKRANFAAGPGFSLLSK